MKELKDVTNWYVFGVSLGIPLRKLDTIKKEYSDVEEQKIKMFQFWLRNKLDASWKKVIQVLEQNGYNVLAVTLREKYLLSSEGKGMHRYNVGVVNSEEGLVPLPVSDDNNCLLTINLGYSSRLAGRHVQHQTDVYSMCITVSTVLFMFTPNDTAFGVIIDSTYSRRHK